MCGARITQILDSIELPTESNYSYSLAQKFSKELDEKLGIKIEEVEKSILLNAPQTPWAGLDPQALQTPYPEIRFILSQLKLFPSQHLVDLGAGYGRMGLVIGHFYPEIQFSGFEISGERAHEGNRMLLSFKNVKLINEDISKTDWNLPNADVFFIYDFGDLESIIRVVDRLKDLSTRKKIRVVGRGRRSRDHIERHEPWLSQVHPPVHCGNFSIYQS